MISAFPSAAPFAAAAVAPETAATNAAILAEAERAPDRWSFTPAELRRFRREGRSVFRLQQKRDDAETLLAAVPGRPPVPVRVIRPRVGGGDRGAFLHIHGGGWMLGAADLQDERLGETADRTELVAISVDYRLAPEDPYPAANDDCETAALWLVAGEGRRLLGEGPLAIGGESAGAHLSVTTLLRLRDRHGLQPFAGAVLVCGAFDLALTPSMRAFTKPLVLSRRDVEHFRAAYLRSGERLDDPDVSPLHADLCGLPPALFSCGTEDGLLDDTLFMAARWTAAGNGADLQLWPGGPHAFGGIDMPLAETSNAAIDRWLAALA